MGDCRGELLAQQISKFSPMSVCEALAVQRRIFSDGPATRAEAETLFTVGATFEKNDQAWKRAFVETVTDHLLGQSGEYGFLEFDGEEWLIDMISDEGVANDSANFELLQSVLELAQNATMRLGRLGLFAALKCGNMYDVLDGRIEVAAVATG